MGYDFSYYKMIHSVKVAKPVTTSSADSTTASDKKDKKKEEVSIVINLKRVEVRNPLNFTSNFNANAVISVLQTMFNYEDTDYQSFVLGAVLRPKFDLHETFIREAIKSISGMISTLEMLGITSDLVDKKNNPDNWAWGRTDDGKKLPPDQWLSAYRNLLESIMEQLETQNDDGLIIMCDDYCGGSGLINGIKYVLEDD